MKHRWWHRWTAWVVEYEECPDGEMGVFEFRSRQCKRCPMVEEECRACHRDRLPQVG